MEDKVTTTGKVGRPESWSDELAEEICTEIALGNSLRQVLRKEGMPAMKTVFSWFKTHPEFKVMYQAATQERTEAMAEDILEIADDRDEDVQRSRLKVDTRKWVMAKMKPKKYGDKLDLTSDGEKLPTPIYGGMSGKPDKL